MDEFDLDNPTLEGDDGQDGAVGRQDDDLDNEGEGGEGAGAAARQEADHQHNAAMKAARHSGEVDAEKRLKKQYDDTIAGYGVPNPYTGKSFASFEEFLEYGKRYSQEQLKVKAQKANRPVEELEQDDEDKKFLKQLREKEAEKAESEKKAQEHQEWLGKDLSAFIAKYPDVDAGKLEANPKFKKFAGSRLYQEPLATLYEDFREFTNDTEAAALAKQASKDERSTGAGGSSRDSVLTAAEQKELNEWNARYPNEKMTAAEFKKR